MTLSIEDKIEIGLNKQTIFQMVRQAAMENLKNVDLNNCLEFDYENNILKITLGMENEIKLTDIVAALKKIKP